MKYYNYIDLGIVSAKLPDDPWLFCEDDNGVLYLVDNAGDTNMYKSTDKGDNWTQPNGDWAIGSSIRALWLDQPNDKLYGAADDDVFYIDLTNDAVTDLGVPVVGAAEPGNDKYVIDVWIMGGDIYCGVYYYDLGVEYFYSINKWGGAAWAEEDKLAWNLVDYPGNLMPTLGVVVGGVYYFIDFDGADTEVKVMSFTSATSTIALLDTIANRGTASSLRPTAYDGDDVFYFIAEVAAVKYLHGYSITGDTTTTYGEHHIFMMRDCMTGSGLMEKAYHLTNYEIYELHSQLPQQLYLIAKPSTDAVIIGITDNFFINSDGDMWEYVDMCYKFLDVEINHEIMERPIATAMQKLNDIPLEEGMMIKFYHNYTTATATSEEIVFEGFIERLGQHHFQDVILRSAAHEDLEEKPTGDYSGRSDEIITSLLTDYCDYITKGTFSVGTAMGTITFGGIFTLETILDELAMFEDWVWYITPTGVLYFTNGTTDSGENFTEISPIFGIIPSKSRGEYNKIKVNGAYIDGVQMVSSWQEDLESQQKIGMKKREFDFGFLDTVALCNTAATAVLSRLGIVPQEVKFNHKDDTVGFIQPGETVTFEYTQSGMTIASDQFIINKTSLNKAGITIYRISSDLL